MEYGQLISALQTRKLMERQLKTSSTIQLLTAYFTYQAFKWVDVACVKTKPRLVVRGLANDFVNGASSIDAIISALESGWEVGFLFPLHAKIYAFDEVVIVGSGNLTSNGLNLLNESGNYELNVPLKRNSKTDETTSHVIQLSTNIDLKTAKAMKQFILAQQQEGSRGSTSFWPTELLPMPSRPLLVADFPSEPYDSGKCPVNEPWATVFRKIQANDCESAAQIVRGSASFSWFCETLKRQGNKLHFGGISSSLHSEIVEDTRVYRRTIKQTLVNFLSYLSALSLPEIEISRPNHTQIVELKH